jgi:hypothetical protein
VLIEVSNRITLGHTDAKPYAAASAAYSNW